MNVSVVVPTRRRPRQLAATVESILSNPGDDWELIVVDQGGTVDSEQALIDAGLLADHRLRYHSQSSRGACRARNYGLALASGDLLIFTDDDCIVPADWIDGVKRWFVDVPDLAVLFGAVKAPPSSDGWIAQFEPVVEGVVALRPRNVIRSLGLAGNMAVRRQAFDRIGAFDELLGAGAVFAPSDDTDYGYRALRLGLKVVAASEPMVIHHGIQRAGKQSAGYLVGMAAMCAKHVRCGDVRMLIPPLTTMTALLGRGTLRLLTGRRPSGYRGAAGIVHGFVGSLRYGVDTRTRLYQA